MITGEEEAGKLVSMPKGMQPISFDTAVITGLKGQIPKLLEDAVS